jgi:hypothetical protein
MVRFTLGRSTYRVAASARIRYSSVLVLFLVLAAPARAQTDFAKEAQGVRALIQQGKFQDAEQARRNLAEKAAKLWGSDDVRTSEAALYLDGALKLAHGNFDDAEEQFQKTLVECERLKLAKHPLACRAANDLGVVYYHRARYPKAQELFKDTQAKRGATLGLQHADSLQSQRNLAFAELSLGNFARAQDLLRENLQGLQKLLADAAATPTTSAEAVLVVESRPSFPRIQVVRSFYAPQPKPRDLHPDFDAARAEALGRLAVVGFHLHGTPAPQEFTTQAYALHKNCTARTTRARPW